MPSTRCGFNTTEGIAGADLLVAHGPTLSVDIGFDPHYLPAPAARPTLAETKLWALVDTGAGESCIDDELAQSLALPVVDRQRVAGVGGAHTVNMYLAQIHVVALGFTIWGAFAGVNLIAGGQRHYALIGRSFLRHFEMSYSGTTGDVTLTLSPTAMPSTANPTA